VHLGCSRVQQRHSGVHLRYVGEHLGYSGVQQRYVGEHLGYSGVQQRACGVQQEPNSVLPGHIGVLLECDGVLKAPNAHSGFVAEVQWFTSWVQGCVAGTLWCLTCMVEGYNKPGSSLII
jgi:hypothetical protein